MNQSLRTFFKDLHFGSSFHCYEKYEKIVNVNNHFKICALKQD